MKKLKVRVEAFIYVVTHYFPTWLYCKIVGGDCSLKITAPDGEVLWDLGNKELSRKSEGLFKKM